MKKLLSVALAAATVASVGVTAFATDYDMAICRSTMTTRVLSMQIINDTVTPDQKVYVKLDDVGHLIFGNLNGPSYVPGEVLNDEDFSSSNTRRAPTTAR